MLLIVNIVLKVQVCSRISLSGLLSLLLIVVVVADCYHCVYVDFVLTFIIGCLIFC